MVKCSSVHLKYVRNNTNSGQRRNNFVIVDVGPQDPRSLRCLVFGADNPRVLYVRPAEIVQEQQPIFKPRSVAIFFLFWLLLMLFVLFAASRESVNVFYDQGANVDDFKNSSDVEYVADI